MLAKMAWKLASESNALWSQVRRTKYLIGQSFFQHVLKPGASFVWRGLLSARQWILKGAYFQLADGSNINVWSDLWVLILAGKIPRPSDGVFQCGVSKVLELKNETGEGWNEGLLKNLFTEDAANGILSLRWPNFDCNDKLMSMGLKAWGFYWKLF